ncbi:MAG: alpha/beta hydrolase [Alphaproteobacteria bacterium]|nr:MAG: alpha/beta hydrolase [Alphaproteobacteria bacterium]
MAGGVVMASYRYGPDERHSLDIYTPRGTDQLNDVIVFFYGGRWRDGNRATYRFLGGILSRQGYLVVIPDYRIFPQVRFPTFMEDAALVIKWTRDNISGLGGNPDNIIVMGHSSGAHMAALLLTNTSFLAAQDLRREHVKRFVGLSGPYSFNPLDYQSTAEIFGTANDISLARPIKNVSGLEPPMLLIHGEQDETVYPINTLNLTKAVCHAGGQARSIIYPNLGHKGTLVAMWQPLRWRAPVLRDFLRFLKTDGG